MSHSNPSFHRRGNPESSHGLGRKLYQAKCGQSAPHKFSHSLLKALVSRVSRRISILMVRFCRSTWLVQSGSDRDWPMTGTTSVETTSAGEYRLAFRGRPVHFDELRETRSDSVFVDCRRRIPTTRRLARSI